MVFIVEILLILLFENGVQFGGYCCFILAIHVKECVVIQLRRFFLLDNAEANVTMSSVGQLFFADVGGGGLVSRCRDHPLSLLKILFHVRCWLWGGGRGRFRNW